MVAAKEIAFAERTLADLRPAYDLGVTPLTGAATLEVAIPTTPGRRGFGPALALTLGDDALGGIFGVGTTLSGLPYVGIDTREGLPRYDGTDRIVFEGQVATLAPPHEHIGLRLQLISGMMEAGRLGDETNVMVTMVPARDHRIITSHAQNDAGVLPATADEELSVPFVGEPALATFRLSFAGASDTFDRRHGQCYLHLTYTGEFIQARCAAKMAAARNGFGLLKEHISGIGGLKRVLNFNEEYGGVLTRLTRTPGVAIPFELKPEHWLYVLRDRRIGLQVTDVRVLVDGSDPSTGVSTSLTGVTVALNGHPVTLGTGYVARELGVSELIGAHTLALVATPAQARAISNVRIELTVRTEPVINA